MRARPELLLWRETIAPILTCSVKNSALEFPSGSRFEPNCQARRVSDYNMSVPRDGGDAAQSEKGYVTDDADGDTTRERSVAKRRRTDGAAHGSYKGYYRRRLAGNYADGDDRLGLLQRAWVRKGCVLDVGCNDGAFTLEVARQFAPAEVVGIDLSLGLILKARSTLRRLALDKQVGLGGEVEREEEGGHEFPFNLTFRNHDFAAEEACRTATEHGVYDMVLCLSVTKWVHMHGGDEALKRFFARVRTCLAPGGVLVLEPQMEISYKRARQKSDTNEPLPDFQTLKLRPSAFREYLLSEEGGFESVDVLRDIRAKGQAFNRPVYAFFKSSKVDDSVASDANASHNRQ